ncbi:serine hydrolase [Candidatus Acetothermia bacterium]|jgi:CubicO group peptidase (beta-lactamase class C family)|nr:serine hydrolase [Candidatus Acetothermia bacterium]
MLQRLNDFNDFITTTMDEWKVPGLAVAIAKEEKVVFCEGFGLREVAKGLKVTPETIFAIGSSSKAFTTMAVGILVDDGKLDWDRPLRNYLPTFKLYDHFASERMPPHDLITHRCGLPRHDLMWYNTAFSRQEIFDRLQYLAPSKDFRAYFQYQNLMYMTAGYLVGELSGSSWEEFVKERILDPLEMTSSNFSVCESQRASDFALPYTEKDDKIKEIPFRNIDVVGPAGSINSSVNDMINWLLLHLGKGRYKGLQIISEGNLNQMHTPQMVIQEMVSSLAAFTRYDEIGHATYGLGWFIQPYRGHNLIHHGGNIDGFSALVSFMPQHGIGVVVLTNLNGNPLPMIISFNVYDRLLKLDEIPWSQRIKKEADRLKETQAKAKEKSATDRKAETQPSHRLEDYTGSFEHPGYGSISIACKGNNLVATYNAMDFPLTHYHYDIFEMIYELFDMRMKISFLTDVKGNINRLAIPMEPSVEEIVFTRVPEKRMTDRSFLEQFAGEYELFDRNIIISLKGEDVLVLSIPDQTDYELVPYQGAEFTFKGLPGFSIEFKQDESGVVTEAVVTQPNAVFTARKK